MKRSLLALLFSSGMVAVLVIFILMASTAGPRNNVQVLDGGAIYIGDKDLSVVANIGYKVLVVDSVGLSQEVVSGLVGNNELLLGYINLGRVTGDKYGDVLSSMNITHSDFGGGILVEFWQDGWMSILIGEVNYLYRLGFKGVLFDDADIYKYLEDSGVWWIKDRDLYMDMRNLVVNLIKYCRDKFGASFLIFLGFSSDLFLLEDSFISGNIDGILFKGLWHELDDGRVVKICECDVKHIFAILDEALSDGKLIIVADPVGDESDANEFCKIARLRGYIPVPQPAKNWGFNYVPPLSYYG